MDKFILIGDSDIIDVAAPVYDKSVLEYYESKRVDGSFLKVIFNAKSYEKNFYFFDRGVKVEMPFQRCNSLLGQVMFEIGRPYVVQVTKVDFENGVVTVSHANVIKKVKAAYKADIKEKLEKGERVEYPAVVAHVGRMYVVVDIAGAGIRGFVPVSEWEVGRVKNLGSVKRGQRVNVVITGLETRKKDNVDQGFLCSRRMCLANTDKYFELEEMYPRGTTVRVKAVALKKINWYGRIDGLEGIDAYGYYPNDRNQFGDDVTDVEIIEGHIYQAKVWWVSNSEQKIRLKVEFDETLRAMRGDR